MTTAMITYRFSETIDFENLSTPEIDTALYGFLQKNLAADHIIDVCEFREVDSQIDYVEFPDRPESEIYIEIILDVEEALILEYKNKRAEINDFVRRSITEDNLIYEQHMMQGNDKYVIVKVIKLNESHI